MTRPPLGRPRPFLFGNGDRDLAPPFGFFPQSGAFTRSRCLTREPDAMPRLLQIPMLNRYDRHPASLRRYPVAMPVNIAHRGRPASSISQQGITLLCERDCSQIQKGPPLSKGAGTHPRTPCSASKRKPRQSGRGLSPIVPTAWRALGRAWLARDGCAVLPLAIEAAATVGSRQLCLGRVGRCSAVATHVTGLHPVTGFPT
jgi:hypothetical protein